MQTTYHLIADTSPWMGFPSLSTQTRSELAAVMRLRGFSGCKAFCLCRLHNPSPSGEKTLFNNGPRTGALFTAVVCNQQLTDGED